MRNDPAACVVVDRVAIDAEERRGFVGGHARRLSRLGADFGASGQWAPLTSSGTRERTL